MGQCDTCKPYCALKLQISNIYYKNFTRLFTHHDQAAISHQHIGVQPDRALRSKARLSNTVIIRFTLSADVRLDGLLVCDNFA